MYSRDKDKLALLVGRWVTPHEGHKALIAEAIERYGGALVAVRDTDEEPSAPHRITLLCDLLGYDLHCKCRFIIIPDIVAVCYGRDVGYEVVKIDLDEETEKIRGSDIRNG